MAAEMVSSMGPLRQIIRSCGVLGGGSGGARSVLPGASYLE